MSFDAVTLTALDDLTEDCMFNLASSSSDGKADDAMHAANGSSPRTCLSCFSLAFSIPPHPRSLRHRFLRSEWT